jgi:cellulose synthase/poly-beta-1,6-N-acetylglucosamine synthase-like glycosyltransferase
MKTLSIVAIVIDNLEITKRFISSIRQYTVGNYELILIDNESNDKETIDFIKNSADKHFRFDKRMSVAHAWNKGIDLAEGEYIVIANNDTIVPKEWFGKLKKPFDIDKKCGIVSPLTFWNYNFGLDTKRIKPLTSFFKNSNSKLIKLKKWNQGIWGEFLLFKRKTLIELGKFSEEYPIASAEDIDLLFTYYKNGYNIYIQPEVFVYHEGNASHKLLGKEKEKIWDNNYHRIFVTKWKEYSKDI